MALGTDLVKLGITFAILLVGFGLMRFFTRVTIKLRRAAVKEASLGRPFTSVFEKIFFAVVIVIAMVFLGVSPAQDFAFRFLDILPDMLLLILVVILGILVIQLITWMLEKLVVYTRLQETVSDEIGRNILPVILISVKILLYVLLADIAVSYIEIPGIKSLENFILYPLTIVIFLVFLVALFNPVRDFASNFYLRNIWRFQHGNRIRFEGKTYTIKDISWFSTELETETGDYLVIPNRVLAGRGIEFEKPSHELKTLEDIKNRFVAQLPSLCGPACAQIVLSIFKINSTQEELADMMGSIVRKTDRQIAGTHPLKLIKAVERLTDKKVLGAWIGFEKIYNLKNEINTWLGEGALIIVDYKKKYLFPTALRAHYSVVVGIRGDELLVVDPSGKKGGVYFSDYRDILVGMDTYSELIKGKRGYIVLAPRGTTAYQRIKEGLIYHHPSMYDRLSKALETRLHKITSAPAIVEMLPEFLRSRLKNYEKEQVSRVWKP